MSVHHHKVDPSVIRSSNDIHSASSPTILVAQRNLSYDDIPAGVSQRSGLIDEIPIAHRQEYTLKKKQNQHHHFTHHDAKKKNSYNVAKHESNVTHSANARAVPQYDSYQSDEWRRRLKEDDADNERFSKLRTDHRNMKDGEKRAKAAAMVKVNPEKVKGAITVIARPYTAVPPAPPAITADLPDVWYAQHRQQLKQEHLLKEQQRLSELANEKAESNNSFGFKVKRALSNTSAKLEHTANSASKGSENMAIESYEMQAHQRLAKYWPNLSAERFICSFDAEVIHEDYPISGYVILTEKTLCFMGRGYVRLEPEWREEGEDGSPLAQTAQNASVASRVTDSSISKKSTSGSFFTTTNSSFFISGDDKKRPVTIIQSIPFGNILSYAHGVVLKCQDKHKTFVAPVPRGAEAQMKPNAILFYAKDGFVYQFRHIRSNASSLLKDGHKDSPYDRFVNFFDHAWRAQGCSHQQLETIPTGVISNNEPIVPL